MNASGTSWFDWGRYRRDSARVAGGFWPKVKRTLGFVPFLDQALAAYYCTRDPATPTYVKAVLVGALAYFVMPADMIPDVLAGLGYTDDAAVLATAVRTVAPAIKDQHREQARAALERETV